MSVGGGTVPKRVSGRKIFVIAAAVVIVLFIGLHATPETAVRVRGLPATAAPGARLSRVLLDDTMGMPPEAVRHAVKFIDVSRPGRTHVLYAVNRKAFLYFATPVA